MKRPIWITPITLEEVNRRIHNTLPHHLGIEFTEIGPDFLKATLPIAPKAMQPMGVMHGGASAALAETVASAAGNYCVDQTLYACVGMELNINHLRPVKEGQVVEAVTRPLHLGKTTQVWDIQVYNQEKKLVSASRLTLAVLSKKSGAV